MGTMIAALVGFGLLSFILSAILPGDWFVFAWTTGGRSRSRSRRRRSGRSRRRRR